MRNLLTIAAGFVALAAVAGCETGPGEAKEAPVLTVTSPARSLIQGHAGQLTVSGTALPNAKGDRVEKVLVNDVEATLSPDGSFSAVIDVNEGATLIETVARDANGVTANDTRAVHAGQLRAVGANIDRALAVSMSADSFAKISAAAGPILKGLNMASLIAPLQPMIHVDDENGEDCAFARLFVDDIKFTDVKISLSPVQGGLAFRAEIDNLSIPAHARWAALCATFQENLRVSAGKVVIAGTLNVTAAGLVGFLTRIRNPQIALTSLRLEAEHVPTWVTDLLHVNEAIQAVLPAAAELAMSPLINLALGGLSGPQQLNVLGKKLDLQVAPRDIAFDPTGAILALNMKVLLEGSQSSPGFIFTNNGSPGMDATYGFQIGLADDLLNEMLAELHAIGMLNVTVPKDVGLFDTAQIQMTMPPVISADANNGELQIVLGDMGATFTKKGAPVAKAAINARIALQIVPVGAGGSIALKLGAPELHVDPLDDIANTTGIDPHDLSVATAACVNAQIDAISKLLVSIPLPAVAGLQFQNLAIGADAGYLMVSGQLQ